MRHWIIVAILVLVSGCQSLLIVRGPNRNVNSLVVEVDWTTAQPPSQMVLNALKGQLQQIVDPNITVAFQLDDDLSGQGHSTWTKSDCSSFALAHKDQDGLYVIWAAGHLDGAAMVGGYSWDKRSCIVFPDVNGPTGGMIQIATSHEIMHCLGLCGKYLKMQEPHQHSYGNHCVENGCLMLPSTYGTLPCAKCRADLEAGEEK